VLARGLRERGSAVVKQAAMTASNIFSLARRRCLLFPLPDFLARSALTVVDMVSSAAGARRRKDMAPFLPILLPELEKAAGHSNPEVREKALVALGEIASLPPSWPTITIVRVRSSWALTDCAVRPTISPGVLQKGKAAGLDSPGLSPAAGGKAGEVVDALSLDGASGTQKRMLIELKGEHCLCSQLSQTLQHLTGES
jgi:hypothetical protein